MFSLEAQFNWFGGYLLYRLLPLVIENSMSGAKTKIDVELEPSLVYTLWHVWMTTKFLSHVTIGFSDQLIIIIILKLMLLQANASKVSKKIFTLWTIAYKNLFASISIIAVPLILYFNHRMVKLTLAGLKFGKLVKKSF